MRWRSIFLNPYTGTLFYRDSMYVHICANRKLPCVRIRVCASQTCPMTCMSINLDLCMLVKLLTQARPPPVTTMTSTMVAAIIGSQIGDPSQIPSLLQSESINKTKVQNRQVDGWPSERSIPIRAAHLNLSKHPKRLPET